MNDARTRTQRVIVIGAGLGGLSAAVSLAAEGFSVTVHEKNDKVGGKLDVLEMEGFTFDLGPSILTLPHLFARLFERAGRKMEDYVAIESLDLHWRNFFEDGTVIDLYPEMSRMERELSKLPPDESDGFYAYLEQARKFFRIAEESYLGKGFDSIAEVSGLSDIKKGLIVFDRFRSLDDSVRRYVRHPKLIDIFDYFVKYVGSSAYDAPALMGLIAYAQFGHGLWYVSGGMYNLARGLRKLAEELGVAIELRSEVVQITREGPRVTGVVLRDGARSAADVIVCNMEFIPAYEKLLDEEPSFLGRWRRFEPACSGLVAHLGVDRRYPRLAHHNFFHSKDARRHFRSIFHDRRLPDDPTVYVVAPTGTDPSTAPPGCEIIKVLPHAPHIRDEAPYSRSDYEAFKERVLMKLERMGLVDLTGHIVCEHVLTPEDIRDRYYSNKGAIYGVVADRFKNFGLKGPKRSPKYRNLYFVGGSVNPGGGMPMAVLCGQQVRDKILEDLGIGAPERTPPA